MADRLVTESNISIDEDIFALCNPKETWSPRFKYDAISDIENNLHSYFVKINGKRINFIVVVNKGQKRLVLEIIKL